jgi:hypothetical protein
MKTKKKYNPDPVSIYLYKRSEQAINECRQCYGFPYKAQKSRIKAPNCLGSGFNQNEQEQPNS